MRDTNRESHLQKQTQKERHQMSQELIRCFSKTDHVLFAYTRQRNYNMVHHFEFGLEQTRGG